MDNNENRPMEKMIQAARGCKSPEEIISLAKENNVEITAVQAEKYYKMIHPATEELAEDELNNVTGGGCGSSSDSSIYPITLNFARGNYLDSIYKKMKMYLDPAMDTFVWDWVWANIPYNWNERYSTCDVTITITSSTTWQ